MDDDTQDPTNIVALESYRARLAATRRGRRAAALFAEADPERAIRALPGDELYYLLREDDPSEARELLAYARAEQVQVVLDFGLWAGDQLSLSRMEEWVAVMAEMPVETIGTWIKGLDTELVALLLRKGARIYDLSMEEAPDETVGIAFETPDRAFVIDATGYTPPVEAPAGEEGGDEGPQAPVSAQALVRIIDAMYRTDLEYARRILVGARSELDSEMEEMALRWRQGRMADLGFIDAVEALEIYRELDPATVHIGEVRPGTRTRPSGAGDASEAGVAPSPLQRAPAILAEELGGSSLFARALGRVTSRQELDEIHFALVGLANRVLAADRIDPADDQGVAAGVRRMRATLDLAVEYLARAGGRVVDEDRAVDAVRTVAAMRLHRLGVSLLGKVRGLARSLVRQGPFSAVAGLDLAEEPEATVLEAVNRARPHYPALLDDPPSSGVRPFGTLSEIARAALAVERAAAAQAMLLGLGVRPHHLVPEALDDVSPVDRTAIDTALLARTAILLLAKDGLTTPSADTFRPLTPAEAAHFNAGGSKVAGLPTIARRILEAVEPPGLGTAARDVTERWLATLSPLEPVLVRGSTSPVTAARPSAEPAAVIGTKPAKIPSKKPVLKAAPRPAAPRPARSKSKAAGTKAPTKTKKSAAKTSKQAPTKTSTKTSTKASPRRPRR